MNTDKILPIDLYHAVSTANLTLESTLKIIHVEVGEESSNAKRLERKSP